MTTLAEVQARYIAHHRALGHSEKTIKHYLDSFAIFHRFLMEAGHEATLPQLTYQRFEEFIGWLRVTPTRGFRGNQTRTAEGIHGVMKDWRALARYLAEEGLIVNAPKVPVPKVPQRLFAVLTPEELERIFHSRQLDITTEIGNRNRALVAFMLDTGVRLGEVANLEMDALNLTDGSARISGKGHKQRMVYFSDGTAEAIRRWLIIRGESPGRLFWLQPPGVRMVFARVKAETGLPTLFAHQLRHTCFTMLVRDGVDLHTVKRLAGHSSVTTTEGYLAMADTDLKAKQRAASPFDRINARLEPDTRKGQRRLKVS